MKQPLYRSKLRPTLSLASDGGVPGGEMPKGAWFPTLDKGYVRLVDWMGSDLEVANDAKVSFMKESLQFGDGEQSIVQFLGDHDHTSPFRHQFVKLEIYAPLMVARQWWKYVVGGHWNDDGWNEASRRYVTMEPEFYVPQWRGAPANKKQGSEDFLTDARDIREYDEDMEFIIEQGLQMYRRALNFGVAPEQARCFLPAYAMYTAWRWTASLQSVCHFLSQRTDPHAQWEIRQYAEPLEPIIRHLFPSAAPALLENHPIALRKKIAEHADTIKQLIAEAKLLHVKHLGG